MAAESSNSTATYTQGHSRAVLSSHESRTVENSAQFLVPHLKPDYRILDVGCGPGTITSGMARLVPQGSVLGVDLSPDVCQRARSLHPKSGYPNLDFQPYNILSDTSIEPSSFDVIFTSQTVLHLPDPIKAISTMRTLLKPTGFLAMRETDTIAWYPSLPGLELYQRSLDAMLRSSGAPGLNRARELHVWATEAGFQREEIKTGASGTVYSTTEERKWWSEGIMGRLEEESHHRLSREEVIWPDELGGGRRVVGEEGIDVMRRDIEKWKDDEGGWWGALQCEVLCWK